MTAPTEPVNYPISEADKTDKDEKGFEEEALVKYDLVEEPLEKPAGVAIDPPLDVVEYKIPEKGVGVDEIITEGSSAAETSKAKLKEQLRSATDLRTAILKPNR